MSNQERVSKEAQRVAGELGAEVAFCARHLESGTEVALSPDEYRTMASVLKVPIALAVLDRVDEGELDREAMHPFEPADMRAGGWLTAPLIKDRGRLQLSTFSVIDAALRASDNAAWLKMMQILGGIEPVQVFLAKHGLDGIRSTNSVYDDSYERLLKSFGYERAMPASALTDAERVTLLEQHFTAERDACTAAGMVELLARLYRGELLSRSSTDLVLEIMAACETSESKLRALLPPGIKVMDKTGTISGILACDAGLIELPGGNGTVAVMVFAWAPDAGVDALDKVVAHVGRLVYDRFVCTG